MAVESILKELSARSLPMGGFTVFPGKSFDLESTAWSVLALRAADSAEELIPPACRRLRDAQQPEGCLLSAGIAKAYWPTALGALAWKKADGFEDEANKAIAFLKAARGNHPPAENDSPVGHDPALNGWPWNEGAHSWVEPTSLAILALRTAGQANDDRVQEGVRMLIDRQLPGGGWNYGNTTVFGQELHPMPAHTGQALCALAGIASASEIRRSIAYAEDALAQMTTPFSFCWSLYGLRAWKIHVARIPEHVAAIMARQSRYGAYATPLLAMLALAQAVNGDLLDFLLADSVPVSPGFKG